MIKIPNCTLIAISGISYQTDEHIKAIKHSCRGIEFGEVKYIQLGHITDIDSWSKAAIYDLPKYVDTEFCLLIHANGYVVSPESWKDEWLNYDYIGAPWPIPSNDGFTYVDDLGRVQRVGNGVSLRSKKLLDLIATREWKSYFGFYNEDGFICCHNRGWLESKGCRFSPLEVAKWFSRELDIPENADVEKPFAFHINKVFSGRNREYYVN